jgi:hypothetical protein
MSKQRYFQVCADCASISYCHQEMATLCFSVVSLGTNSARCSSLNTKQNIKKNIILTAGTCCHLNSTRRADLQEFNSPLLLSLSLSPIIRSCVNSADHENKQDIVPHMVRVYMLIAALGHSYTVVLLAMTSCRPRVSNLFWQRVTNIIVGLLTGHTCENHNKWCT